MRKRATACRIRRNADTGNLGSLYTRDRGFECRLASRLRKKTLRGQRFDVWDHRKE
ncbi:hypothetical protein CY34DRAFT_798372 [Suillus luteus UH-Slu-Lm8-n1]|uniref:Uncharacterized protein n=1 Tax=Suillus luteus UH-Slu-Lm8-n1 TaxID=930992 RepID=A0A0D0BRG7_9AGAM|nr:hypothetical protein CY34DRAFT_798372 [Suillus luteus UH-Slu-Lm8-n1]